MLSPIETLVQLASIVLFVVGSHTAISKIAQEVTLIYVRVFMMILLRLRFLRLGGNEFGCIALFQVFIERNPSQRLLICLRLCYSGGLSAGYLSIAVDLGLAGEIVWIASDWFYTVTVGNYMAIRPVSGASFISFLFARRYLRFALVTYMVPPL